MDHCQYQMVPLRKYEDFTRMSGAANCPYRKYEQCRVEWVVRKLQKAQIDNVDQMREKTDMLLQYAQQICFHLGNSTSTEVSLRNSKCAIVQFQMYSQELSLFIETLGLPKVRPCVIEFTDAGPGVGCNNFEVQFREIELAKLHKSSLRHRVHLASDDQGQNEAERTNAYIGESVADGCILKIDYFGKHHGLSDDDKDKMTIKQLEAHEARMKEKNAWCIAEDVASRIDSEPGPSGSFMQSFVTDHKEDQFFYNTEFLLKWKKSGKRARKDLPGNNYFVYIENIMQSHLELGELYLEFRACDTCDFCTDLNKAIAPVPRPCPDAETGHYQKYEETSSYKPDSTEPRPKDDFQPRKQCKALFEADKISSQNMDEIQIFCNKFLVGKDVVISYLQHLEYLSLKKKLRKRGKARTEEVTVEVRGDDTVEVIEEGPVIIDDAADSDNSDDSENDLVLNVVEGSDTDMDSDENNVIFVPPTRIITCHGRVAGTWKRNFEIFQESSDDEIIDANVYTTRSGRNVKKKKIVDV